jgi:4-amino-4-deoxy-L-arabinose transferase-like glycosyltransferase
VWLLADLIFLSAAGSKLPTYVLPLFPAVALLTVDAWQFAPAGTQAGAPHSWGRFLTAQALVGAGLIAAACAWAGWLSQIPVGVTAWVGAGLAAVPWLLLAAGAQRWPRHRSFVGTLAAVAGALLVAYGTLFPAVARALSARDLAMHFNNERTLPPRLWIVDERVGSVLFYLVPELRRQVTPDRVEGVALGQALIQGSGIPGTVVAIPGRTATRLRDRVDLERVPSVAAGKYVLFDAAQLRLAPVRDAR